MNIDFQKQREVVQNLKNAGEIEGVLKHDTSYNRFRETALERPDQAAILYMGNTITYRQMLSIIDNAAKGFSEIGIGYNDVVTMSMLSTPYGIASFYALDKIGATMHMVNSASSMEEVKRELNHIKSKYFVANDIFCGEEAMNALKEAGVEKIVTTSLLDCLPMGLNIDKAKYALIEKLKGMKKKSFDGEKVLNFEQLLEKGRYSTKEIEARDFEYNHNATIAYTSGSTGNSKACVATWEGIDSMVQVMAMTEQGRFAPGDTMLTTFPLWIYYSLLNMIHEPLCLGVTLGLDPLFDPKNLVRRNEQYLFNHWLTIPPYIKSVVESKRDTDCSRWKIVLTGGAELPDSVKLNADEYIARNGGNVKVVQGYGASECLGSFAYCYYPDSTIGSLGKPCIGNMLKILDVETKEELGPNESGVGYFYSPALMKEYYGDKEATDHNLVKDENGVIWYNTEDLVHVNDKGEIFLDGRIRRIALALDAEGNPTKIIPERTKKELSKLEMIDKCEVITVADDVTVNKAVAYVVLKDGVEKNETLKENIKDYSKMQVPEYMSAKDVIFIDEMPLNSNGKPDLKELERMYISNECKEEVKATSKIKQLFRKNK